MDLTSLIAMELTGQLIVPKDEIIREELLAEAEFYQVEGIIKVMKVSFLEDSVILSSDQRQTLVNWLNMLKGSQTIINERRQRQVVISRFA